MWSLKSLGEPAGTPRSVNSSLRSSALPSPSRSRKHGQVRHVHHVKRTVVPDHAEDRVQLVGEDDGSLPSRNSRIRSIGLSAGPIWSIGSSPTNNDPSGAVATWHGYWTAGTAATSRILKPSGTVGKCSQGRAGRACRDHEPNDRGRQAGQRQVERCMGRFPY